MFSHFEAHLASVQHLKASKSQMKIHHLDSQPTKTHSTGKWSLIHGDHSHGR